MVRSADTSAVQLHLLDASSGRAHGLSALHATFAGGAHEPFNRWYPYLEGYSPEFVRAILSAYAPHAPSVLDPFGGTATTAFVAAEQGRDGFICEVNPVLQAVFAAKVAVRTASLSKRREAAGRLRALVNELADALEGAEPDTQLSACYESTFGRSIYFSDAAFEGVLRARTLADKVGEDDRLAGELVTVAILAALLPASYLKRAGDVRFMTEKELQRGVPAFTDVLKASISLIVQDLGQDGYELSAQPRLVCGDARELRGLDSLGVHALVTSPPYINGTNYFRNTRLELWFLRHLRNKADLAAFRRLAITGGINDVTVGKSAASPHPQVEKVVQQLEVDAYDARIPLMVSSYFAEITEAFAAAREHLVAGSPVAIDIGDSNYGGVHVPADALLKACLRDVGFQHVKDVHLRARRSKNGAPLKQVLLLFHAQRGRRLSVVRSDHAHEWQDDWSTFKQSLPHQAHPYSARNWGSGLHSLCSYPGKLKPAIAHHLVRTFVPGRGSVLDPFGGVGTIPLEAALMGRTAYSLDLSAAAHVVTASKLTINDATRTREVIERLERWVESYRPTDQELEETRSFGLNKRVVDYYHPETLREVLAARAFFQLEPLEPSSLLVYAATLHLLHGNRPYAFSRRSHPLTPYSPTGPTEYRGVLERIRAKVDRSLAEELPDAFQPGVAFHQDSTLAWPDDARELDAVITSPPFFNSTRFHTQNWLRLWFSGWTPEMFASEPARFVDERQKRGFDVYESLLRQARERLKAGGVVVLHLGKSSKCDMAASLRAVGQKFFPHADLFDESVAHCESHGMRDKGTVTSHQYLVLY